MRTFFQNIFLWVYLKTRLSIYNISGALVGTDDELLRIKSFDSNERNKKETRKLHRNQTLEKFYAGQRDEKYTQDYYELLKKSDKFLKKATPRDMEIASYKYGTNYGMKDQYGRRYEHYGFFDLGHKHAGKTLGEVLILEYEERRTKDDDFEILYVFNNKPIEVGMTKILDILEKTETKVDENNDINFFNTSTEKEEYKVVDMLNKSKSFKFPIKVSRNNDGCLNKIEQLTEFLHVKKIGFEYRQLEFFVPLKFKTEELNENSDIFKELINIDYISIMDNYGQSLDFRVIKFLKRTINNNYNVFKFKGFEMENVNVR
jgi:hypothetical protein